MFENKFINPEYDNNCLGGFIDKSIKQILKHYLEEIHHYLNSSSEEGELIEDFGNHNAIELTKTFWEKYILRAHIFLVLQIQYQIMEYIMKKVQKLP